MIDSVTLKKSVNCTIVRCIPLLVARPSHVCAPMNIFHVPLVAARENKMKPFDKHFPFGLRQCTLSEIKKNNSFAIQQKK